MKQTLVIMSLLTAVLVFGGLASVPEASANRDCLRSCKSELKLCSKGVREAFKGCRESCKRTRGGKACILSCKDTMLVARQDCKDGLPACAQACESEIGSGESGSSGEVSCEGTCNQNFRGCLGDGVDFARLCGRQCIVDRKDDFAGCRDNPNPLACYLYAGLTAAQCLMDCGGQIREWPGMCRAELGQCLTCLLYTSPSPRDKRQSRMPSSA